MPTRPYLRKHNELVHSEQLLERLLDKHAAGLDKYFKPEEDSVYTLVTDSTDTGNQVMAESQRGRRRQAAVPAGLQR